MGNTKDLVTEANILSTSFLKTSDTLQACHTSLSTSACLLAALVEKIEVKARELEEKEENLNMREEGITKRVKELEEQRNDLDKLDKSLKKRAKLILELEEKWNDTQLRMEENAQKLPHLISISVGGQRFVVPKDHLLKHKGSYFEAMLTTDHPQQVNDEFYINYSPKHFQVILDFLRNDNIEFDGNHDELRKYFQFFCLPDPFPPITPPEPAPQPELSPEIKEIKEEVPPPAPPVVPAVAAPEPALFEGGDFLVQSLQLHFKEWIPNCTFSLLYKATRDGFSAKKFHEHCDHRGPTITLIQSKEGFLFGGYSSIPLSASLYTTSHVADTFIFTLTNPYNITPTTYKHIKGTPGVNSSPSSCAIFGEKVSLWGRVKHDICLGSNANKHPCLINFPQCYEDTTGKGDSTFTGHSSFTASEIEVYLVKNSK